jgi:hypothetical protein
MERNTPALPLSHPELLPLTQQPLAQSFSCLSINLWTIKRTVSIEG